MHTDQQSATIRIIVNGIDRAVHAGSSVRDVVVAVGLGGAACAAEVNGAVVRRAAHESTIVRSGDRVELVSLVGGG